MNIRLCWTLQAYFGFVQVMQSYVIRKYKLAFYGLYELVAIVMSYLILVIISIVLVYWSVLNPNLLSRIEYFSFCADLQPGQFSYFQHN
jgi:hypothetical protein